MSLEQLERQIAVATEAMERANQAGDKRMKGEMKKELDNFKLVLEKSKAKLKELEKMKKQCNDLSTRRSNRMEKLNRDGSDSSVQSSKKRSSKKGGKEKDKTKYYLNNSIVIPWLQPKPKKSEKKKEKKQQHQEAEKKRQVTPPPTPPPQAEDRNDIEQGGTRMLQMALEYGNHVVATGTQIFTSGSGSDSVSTLGSQIFGTSEITKAREKEDTKREEEKLKRQKERETHQHSYNRPPPIHEALRRNSEASSRIRADEEEESRDQPLDVPSAFTGILSTGAHITRNTPSSPVPSSPFISPASSRRSSFAGIKFTRTFSIGSQKNKNVAAGTLDDLSVCDSTSTDEQDILTAEQIAEEELKAREQCITATKKHQDLKRSGYADNSPQVKESEKILRDCYAQIEYWECLAEEAGANGGGGGGGGGVGSSNSIITGNRSNVGGSVLMGKLQTHGRDLKNLQPLDVDSELSKARDAYSYAIARHQTLVIGNIRTSSPEWLKSQGRVNESLANLKYWEGQASAFSPPPTICNNVSGTLGGR